MDKMRYAVLAQVPLGERRGILTLTQREDHCEGTLEMMHVCNEVRGTLDAQGNCRLTGVLHTLLRAWPFMAEGVCTPEGAELTLSFGRLHCALHGERMQET